jgi:hypothetical protein
MATTYASFSSLERSAPETYSLIVRLGNLSDYVYQSGGWDMKTLEGWLCSSNYELLSEKHLRAFLRLLSAKRDKSLFEVLDQFRFELQLISVEGDTFRIPTGAICGWLNGLFMYIDADGRINT